jgi:hypothetical protein
VVALHEPVSLARVDDEFVLGPVPAERAMEVDRLSAVLPVISTARLSQVMQHAMPPSVLQRRTGGLSGCMLALALFGVDRR